MTWVLFLFGDVRFRFGRGEAEYGSRFVRLWTDMSLLLSFSGATGGAEVAP